MKVARKKPEAVKSPVYVTQTQYEIWYAKPISLGLINNVNGYWHTVDGMRFVSSRDAMEYLIRLHELTAPQAPRMQAELSPQQKQKLVGAVRSERQQQRRSRETLVTRLRKAGSESPAAAPAAPSTNHSVDSLFREFMEWQKKRISTPNSSN